MCYAEGWKTYHRRVRYRRKEELRKFKKALQSNLNVEIYEGRKIKPQGCVICAYKKKYAGTYRVDQPKKNKNHNSTRLRLTYRRFTQLKRSNAVFFFF